ncbi:hypothetical protein Lser_V15G25726 [Lactuca serriola]
MGSKLSKVDEVSWKLLNTSEVGSKLLSNENILKATRGVRNRRLPPDSNSNLVSPLSPSDIITFFC